MLRPSIRFFEETWCVSHKSEWYLQCWLLDLLFVLKSSASAKIPLVIHRQDFDSYFASQIARLLASHCLQLPLPFLFQLLGKVRELGFKYNDGKWHELRWLERDPAYFRDWASWTKVFLPHWFTSLDFTYIYWLSNSLVVLIWSRTMASIVVMWFSSLDINRVDKYSLLLPKMVVRRRTPFKCLLVWHLPQCEPNPP
jgi:hypothetical protein